MYVYIGWNVHYVRNAYVKYMFVITVIYFSVCMCIYFLNFLVKLQKNLTFIISNKILCNIPILYICAVAFPVAIWKKQKQMHIKLYVTMHPAKKKRANFMIH